MHKLACLRVTVPTVPLEVIQDHQGKNQHGLASSLQKMLESQKLKVVVTSLQNAAHRVGGGEGLQETVANSQRLNGQQHLKRRLLH